jgi:hypothetical protein
MRISRPPGSRTRKRPCSNHSTERTGQPASPSAGAICCVW